MKEIRNKTLTLLGLKSLRADTSWDASKERSFSATISDGQLGMTLIVLQPARVCLTVA